jgi:hypothetical protein
MPKKNKNLENLSQTHGKVEEKEYKTLDQIWGDTGSSRYSTSNEKEYLNYLNELNKSDLQGHANKIGLVPIDNRETLTKRLLAEFKKFTSLYKIPKQKNNTINLNQATKNILAEGK